MNFTQYVFEKSKKCKEKIAIFHKDDQITYSELLSLILKISHKIDTLNINPDEKIILMGDNSLFFVASYFAIIGSGRVLIPIHPDFGETNFTYVCQSCEVHTFFIQKKYWKRFNGYGVNSEIIFTDQDINGTINIFDLEIKKGKIHAVEEKNEIAIIFFTSGSTGTPKGVMLSHYNLRYNTSSIIEYLKLNSSDRVMVVLPFSYVFGASLLHTHLRIGGQIVINNFFMFPGKVLKEINDKKCTVFAGVPSVFSILLRRSPLKKMKFPTLRIVQQAGGKLTKTYIKELMEALPNSQIFIMYGQTEATARISYLQPNLLQSKLGSIGKGIPGTSIEVLKSNGEPVKPGEIGEIVASGGNIMIGYWKDPEATRKVLKQGKLYTGDLGTVDNDGYVYLTERSSEFIKVGGFRVGPKEIENVISELDSIAEVAVIGIFDELLGEAIKAFVSLSNNATISKKDIISFCQKKSPPHKVPKEIEIMKTLPKNISKKIDKVLLKKLEVEKVEKNDDKKKINGKENL
jgi:acyl-CoA synthetase (AMP-forming)/AMP-acid ligase II